VNTGPSVVSGQRATSLPRCRLVQMPCPGCHGKLHINLHTRELRCEHSGYETTYERLGKNVRRGVDEWMAANGFEFLEDGT
jgi:hypothetical protein